MIHFVFKAKKVKMLMIDLVNIHHFDLVNNYHFDLVNIHLFIYFFRFLNSYYHNLKVCVLMYSSSIRPAQAHTAHFLKKDDCMTCNDDACLFAC